MHGSGWRRLCGKWCLCALLLPLLCPRPGAAESAAAKNNRGNRLYEQGRYADAEKAYLEARAAGPAAPEIFYNLGNSLIRQNRLKEGLQALRRAAEGGGELGQKALYNMGNALYSAGHYRESAEAYIEALKLNPADRDAKHNLELALLKQKQQEEEKRNQDTQTSEGKTAGQISGRSRTGDGGTPEARPKPARPEGRMTREEALQLLEAVENQEREERRKAIERRTEAGAKDRDW